MRRSAINHISGKTRSFQVMFTPALFIWLNFKSNQIKSSFYCIAQNHNLRIILLGFDKLYRCAVRPSNHVRKNLKIKNLWNNSRGWILHPRMDRRAINVTCTTLPRRVYQTDAVQHKQPDSGLLERKDFGLLTSALSSWSSLVWTPSANHCKQTIYVSFPVMWAEENISHLLEKEHV